VETKTQAIEYSQNIDFAAPVAQSWIVPKRIRPSFRRFGNKSILKEKPMFKTFSITFLGLLSFSAARAQSSDPVHAYVPFAFAVHNTNLASGNYEFTYSQTAHTLLIRGLDQNLGGAFATFIPVGGAASSSGPGRLVFRCGEGTCYLVEVWQGIDGGRGLKALRTERERELASSMTSITIPTN
jgi:hypothetical protein